MLSISAYQMLNITAVSLLKYCYHRRRVSRYWWNKYCGTICCRFDPGVQACLVWFVCITKWGPIWIWLALFNVCASDRFLSAPIALSRYRRGPRSPVPCGVTLLPPAWPLFYLHTNSSDVLCLVARGLCGPNLRGEAP